MNDLIRSGSPAKRPDTATYMSLFADDKTRCAPGALMANNSRLAYLVYLKALIQAFEVRADVSAPITLLARRPDLLALTLDDRNSRKSLPKVRLITGLLEKRAAEALSANQSLQQEVASGAYRANVPFHHAWESIKATLAAKQLPLWDVLRSTQVSYPAFIYDNLALAPQRAATTLSSGFSPQLQSFLLNGSGQDTPLLATVNTTRKLTKALGLTRRELRQLLAVNAVGENITTVTRSAYVSSVATPSSKVHGATFINNAATPLHLTEAPAVEPPVKKSVLVTGLTDAHLDRLQRILRLQRALDLSAAETDGVVMAALRAEGQTGNYTLTTNTLRALGLFRHLQHKYNVTPWQYAALLNEISPYATDRQVSFYDQLFAPANNDEGAGAHPVLTLDDSEFDPLATSDDDVLTIKQLCLGLKVDDAVLRVILGWVIAAQGLSKPKRSLAVVSACYRIVTLSRVFGSSTLQGLTLLALLIEEQPVYHQQLAGIPDLLGANDKADIVDVIGAVTQAMEWLQQQGLDALQLAKMLSHQVHYRETAWESVFRADADTVQNPDALHLALSEALGLEAGNLVEPLLRWAKIDVQALGARIEVIRQQSANGTSPLSYFTDSDNQQWSTLQRHSDLVKLFKLSADLLQQISLNPGRLDLKGKDKESWRALDLTTVYQLGRYKALLARLAVGQREQDLLSYLAEFDTNLKGPLEDCRVDAAWATLERLLGQPDGTLAALAKIEPPTTLRGINRLLRLLALAGKHNLAVDTLLELSELPHAQDYAPFQQTAIALRKGCSGKQRKGLEEQMSVAWRDALMQWMIIKWAPKEAARSWINSPQTLADYLLIDLQVSHEPLTTRTLSAIASLQRYLHQIHSRLENGYRSASISEAEREEWETFGSSYERWKLRKDAHNEPQNFIDPTRRLRKTTAFNDLESLLAQGKCQPDDIQTAMLGYLSTFEKLSNIQPISVYADGTSPLTDTYHFIGKTNVEPAEYYWRTLDMAQRDQDNAPSMLAWGEWEKITLSLSGQLALTPLPKTHESTEEQTLLKNDLRTHIELVRPVIVAGRRYAVWVEWESTAIAMGKDQRPSKYYPLRVCFAFQQIDGTWSTTNELLRLDGHDLEGKFASEKEPPEVDKNGSATGNPFLKTKAYKPGLMVMVNINGDRLNDPWLTVALFDTLVLGDKNATPLRDNNYFIVSKDLLLLENKELDFNDKKNRPLEKKLIKNWLSFFFDPRVVQHPYEGAITLLKRTATGASPFTWDSAAIEEQSAQYEIATQGDVKIQAALAADRRNIDITVNTDSKWKRRNKGWFVKEITTQSADGIYHATINIKAEVIDNFADQGRSANAFIFAGEHDQLLMKFIGKFNYQIQPDDIKQINEHVKNNYFAITLSSTFKTKQGGSEGTLICTLTSSDPNKSDVKLQEDRSSPSKKFLVSNEFHLTLIEYQVDPVDAEDFFLPIPAYKVEYYGKSQDIRLRAKLSAQYSAATNPSWTLSKPEHNLLDTPGLNELKKLAVDEPEKFAQLKEALLKVRYLSQASYNQTMGISSASQIEAPITFVAAIDTATQRNNADAVAAFISSESAALTAEGVNCSQALLEATLRLRQQDPNAFRRILLYLDVTHTMTFEDVLVADGKGQVTFQTPIQRDVSQYTFTLSVYAQAPDDSKRLGSSTQVYKLEDQQDDATPSVQIRRNDVQALYLDLNEANAKAPEALRLSTQTLRLNTLFGKELVAMATQSVDRALSWEAQHLPEPPLEPGSTHTTVDFRGANGLYFWELFFHVPFLVSWLQRQNREYRQAWRWCTRYLFDPYRTWVPAGNHPPLFWLTQPLLERAAFSAPAEANDPDLLAYAEPERYRKALHLFVVENWQRQGDDQYRLLTFDSLVEAALCYDKALRLIGLLPEDLSTAPSQAPTLASAQSSAFSPPLNNKLVELRNLLRNRLYNLRHGLTLDGKPAAIMLDPDALELIPLGQGGSGEAQGHALKAREVPPCRYDEARKCAGEAVQQLIGLGQTLLSFYGTEASQQLELLSKRNLIKLLDFPCQLQEQALELAERERDTVLTSKEMVQQRLDYYQNLEDEGVNTLETTALNLAISSCALRTASIPFYGLAATVALVPKVFGMAFGNADPQEAAESGANAFEATAELLETASNTVNLQADYLLRHKHWQYEVQQATHELKVLDKQLIAQDVRIKAASIAVAEARATQAAHRAEYEVMTSVFASHTTYLWLIGRLSQIYTLAYDATLSLCMMAEACLQFELGDFESTWVKPQAWLDNWRGMLAGEALARDLMHMDVAAIHDNHRPLDIHKDFSLLDLNGWNKQQLQAQLAKDVIHFELAPWDFDKDFPGQYLRRIERVWLSFNIGKANASTPLSAMLYQTANKVLLTDALDGAMHLYSATEGSANNVLRDLRPNQSIAVWAVKDVNRNFDLQPSVPDKSRYQPFEGTGLISSWKIEFPGGAKNNPGLFNGESCTLEDITLHVIYSAYPGSENFREGVRALLNNRSQSEGDPKNHSGGTSAGSGNADNAIVTAKDAEQAATEALNAALADADSPALKSPEAASEAQQASKAVADARTAVDEAKTARKNAETAGSAGQINEANSAADKAQQAAATASKAAKVVADARKVAEDAAKKRETDAAASKAVAKAKDAEQTATEALNAALADADSPALKAPEAASEAQQASKAVADARTAVDEAKTARKNAETAGSAGQINEANSAADKAQQAAATASKAAKVVADARKVAEDAAKKRETDAAASKAVAKAKDAEQTATEALNAALADADSPALKAPEAASEAQQASKAVADARTAVDEAKTARKNAETAGSAGQINEANSAADKAQQAAATASKAAKVVADARKVAEDAARKRETVAAASKAVAKAKDAEQAANASRDAAQNDANAEALKATDAVEELSTANAAAAQARIAAEEASTARKNAEAAALKGDVATTVEEATKATQAAQKASEAADKAATARKTIEARRASELKQAAIIATAKQYMASDTNRARVYYGQSWVTGRITAVDETHVTVNYYRTGKGQTDLVIPLPQITEIVSA
ncbi:MAG: neuraminidase-like domain-containing protein [Pseudomonas sp.]|uniref:Tc toxin subunit A-related protein n=1 Tax=Pseudomonas sp. TaxID=306 RepID=UPI002FC5B072